MKKNNPLQARFGQTQSVLTASRREILKASLFGGTLGLLSGSAPQLKAEPLAAARGALREYWIQAEAFPHNVVPTGIDATSGMAYAPNQCSFGALGYRAFSPNWASPLPGNDEIGPNTGMPGPTIRAKAGDTIRIHFRNNDRHFGFPHSIHAHGVAYDPDSDGAWTWADQPPGSAVKVGETYTYEYQALPESVGTWPYHEHSVPQTMIPGMPPDMGLNVQLGMSGVIAITDDDTLPADVDNVVVMHDLFAEMVPGLGQDFDCFNGFAYLGNTPTFRARVGQRVRWRVISLGQELHTFHIHGHRWESGGRFVDTEVLGPATTLTFDYVEDRPGRWLYHCHVVDHMMGGMVGYYIVA